MAFPTSPVDGQIFENYRYNTSAGAWLSYIQKPIAINIAKKSVSTASGIKEIFRVNSVGLVTGGILTLSGTRANFVHTSIWTWTSNHVHFGTLTRHNIGNYGAVPIYLDVHLYGSIILSADWNGSMSYEYTVQLFHGAEIDISHEGMLHTDVDTDYTRYTAQ